MPKRLTKFRIDSPEVALAIRGGLDFDTHGSLYGVSDRNRGPGELSGDDLTQYLADTRLGQQRIMYVVMSYSTPIAWCRADKTWHVVDQKFSDTTDRHQRVVRDALGLG